jgi:phage baseplate assembly protein W
MNINFQSGMTETEKKAIYSSISTIAATPYGSAPYLRDMGIRNYTFGQSDLEKNAHSAEVIQQIGEWEDRVSVSGITYNGNEMEVTLQ